MPQSHGNTEYDAIHQGWYRVMSTECSEIIRNQETLLLITFRIMHACNSKYAVSYLTDPVKETISLDRAAKGKIQSGEQRLKQLAGAMGVHVVSKPEDLLFKYLEAFLVKRWKGGAAFNEITNARQVFLKEPEVGYEYWPDCKDVRKG